jgi:dolichyl-phosphooligosaccharide-protein glycotransferase
MDEGRAVRRWIIFALLFIFFGVALYLRVAFLYNQVFVDNTVRYTTTDAYYFMRQVDNLVHNFPHLTSFDPYLSYPTGAVSGSQTLFARLLGGITWVCGLGSPTQHTIDLVSAYAPAVLGALTVLPVYFIGRTLFSQRAGILAAANSWGI